MTSQPAHKGPLASLRVIEMVGVGPGPFAAMWLADMGADVIRIDRPGQRWNQTRGDVLNRGRRSLAIDLKKPGSADVVLRLIEGADALIEGFRPGVMERLGLGPEVCLARNPKLVFGRVTGWGQDGPRAQEAGHDINYLAITGALAAIGPADGRPVPPLNLVADFGGGGMMLVAGVMAALIERSVSGRGQVVDTSMAEGATLLASMMWGYRGKKSWREEREQNLFDGGAPFYGTYRCADGQYVALGAIEPEFWTTFLDRCGIDDPVLRARDKSKWPELRERLAAIFATRPRDEWCRLTEGTDACLSPVLSFTDALSEEHAVARKAFVTVENVAQPSPSPRFDRTPGEVSSPPPLVGEHSREILVASGFSDGEIASLEQAGIVVQAKPGDAPSKDTSPLAQP